MAKFPVSTKNPIDNIYRLIDEILWGMQLHVFFAWYKDGTFLLSLISFVLFRKESKNADWLTSPLEIRIKPAGAECKT